MKLRLATMEDAQYLYNLRKDPDVLKQFFGDMPTWENHIKWLQNVLFNAKGVQLIVEIGGIFAGQVRIAEENGTADISISLTKKFRGKGLASEIIAESLKCTDCDVIALVKRNNIASLRAFAKAGFGCVV